MTLALFKSIKTKNRLYKQYLLNATDINKNNSINTITISKNIKLQAEQNYTRENY